MELINELDGVVAWSQAYEITINADKNAALIFFNRICYSIRRVNYNLTQQLLIMYFT